MGRHNNKYTTFIINMIPPPIILTFFLNIKYSEIAEYITATGGLTKQDNINNKASQPPKGKGR